MKAEAHPRGRRCLAQIAGQLISKSSARLSRSLNLPDANESPILAARYDAGLFSSPPVGLVLDGSCAYCALRALCVPDSPHAWALSGH